MPDALRDHWRFSLQRARAADEVSRMRESAGQIPHQSGVNVGAGQRRDEQFSTICKIAVDNGKPVRIGVNGGSLNQELVMRKMQENTDKNLGKESEENYQRLHGAIGAAIDGAGFGVWAAA